MPLVVEVGQDQAQISLSLQNEMVVVLVDIISTTSLTEDDIDLQQQNKSDGGDGGWKGGWEDVIMGKAVSWRVEAQQRPCR